jgi:hypothetical protein
MSSHARFSTASVAVVLAAGASLFLLAAAQADPQAAAETRYLAFWSTAVLLCAAGLSKQPSFELAGSALLLVLTGWVVPAGPARAATFGLLLTASLGVAILRRLADHSDGIDRSFWVPAALGVQFLARSDQLLTNSMEPKALVGLVVLPLAAAWSLNLLGRSRGVGATLLIGGVCLLLVPGWSVAVLLSLAGVVLGSQSVAGETNRWIRLGGLVLVTVAAYTWHPGLPAVILLTALLIASGERWVGPAAVAMAVAIALVLLPGVRAWDESLLQAGLLLVLLPAAPLVGRKDWPRVISALLLACLAARTVPLPGALAAPLAAVALALPREGTLVTLQRIWTGTLLAGSLLLAAYPWLRVEPLSDTLQLFGARGDWPRALLPAGVVLAVLAVAALLQLPPAGVYSVTGAPVVLTFEQQGVVRDVEVDAPVRSVVIDSYLENSTSLATGTPVAEVTLDTEDGNNQRWLLRVGIESGEWAARREDVASLEGFQAPPPWLTWIPGGSELFAQRYRARWDPPEQATATRIRVARRPELPPEVGIAILRLELRP